MPPVAEPVELATVTIALLALLASLRLCLGAWWAWRAAEAGSPRPALRTLAWMRIRNELIRAAISTAVCYSGSVQATTPAPPVPGPNRALFQVIWLGIAFACLTQSVLNHRDTERVIAEIEREQTEGAG